MLVAAWIGILMHLMGLAITEEYEVPLSEYEGNPPFATMIDLAGGMDEETAVSTYVFTPLGIANTVYEWCDPIAPVNYSWDEIAEVTLDNGRRVEGGLYVDYHETVYPALAQQLAREYVWTENYDSWISNLFSKNKTEPEPMDVKLEGFDFAEAFYNEIHMPTVILQKGNKVIHVTFHQYQNADRIPPEVWIRIMAEAVM